MTRQHAELIEKQWTEDPAYLEEFLQSKAAFDMLADMWHDAGQDPLLFISDFVYTLDTHDKINPIKKFPGSRPHIQAMVKLWQDNPLLAIVKSRQMMQTWLFTALSLWDCLFNEGRLIMLQSKTEREAIGEMWSGQGLLGRCKFIYSQLPIWLRPAMRPKEKKVSFPTRHSTLWAIPQGADIIRSYTSAGILSDECAFQDEFSEAYGASVPTIRGGGWFVALSTAHPGFFQTLWNDNIGSM